MTRTKSPSAVVAICAVLGSTACAGCMRNELDQTEDTDPPYESYNPRTKLEQKRAREAAQDQPRAEQSSEQARLRTVADLTDDPASFIGEKVVIQGAIEQVYRSQAFKLDAASPAHAVNDDLLVVNAKKTSWNIDDAWNDIKVRVEGTLQRAEPDELEKSLARALEPDVRMALAREELVLVADNVQIMKAGSK